MPVMVVCDSLAEKGQLRTASYSTGPRVRGILEECCDILAMFSFFIGHLLVSINTDADLHVTVLGISSLHAREQEVAACGHCWMVMGYVREAAERLIYQEGALPPTKRPFQLQFNDEWNRSFNN